MKYKNNPFNIRSGSNWLGLVGSRNGFCEFDTLEHGIRAFFIIMRHYAVKYKLRTIRGIITRFAPSAENDTEKYISFVSDSMCLSSDEVLSSAEQYWILAHYMARFESGAYLYYDVLEYVWNFYHIRTHVFF